MINFFTEIPKKNFYEQLKSIDQNKKKTIQYQLELCWF